MLLLCHEENDVVCAAHPVRSIRCDLLSELHGSYDFSSVYLKCFYMSFVAVDEFNLNTGFADECSEDGAERAGTVYCCAHIFSFGCCVNIEISVAPISFRINGLCFRWWPFLITNDVLRC